MLFSITTAFKQGQIIQLAAMQNDTDLLETPLYKLTIESFGKYLFN